MVGLGEEDGGNQGVAELEGIHRGIRDEDLGPMKDTKGYKRDSGLTQSTRLQVRSAREATVGQDQAVNREGRQFVGVEN